jgi:hypothetical protein
VSGADKAIRRLTAAAVLLVAAIAATVSYLHIEHLAITHGQVELAAILLPVSIDGTVAAASLVMLHSARAGLPSPRLARFMLGLSVAATLACNVGYGLPYGIAGALISGWPAIGFLGSVEMALTMIRRARSSAPALTESTPAPYAALNGHAHQAAELFAAELESGRVPGIRAIRSGLHVGQDKATEIQHFLRTRVQ